MHFYKHHIGDYRRDTAHLSLLEHGVYRQLLDWYYLEESPIPLETHSVYRRLSARTELEQQAVDAVLSDFFTKTESGWINGRCGDEISEYRANAEANRENGKRGGRPKKAKETEVVIDGLANHNPNESENNLNHKPLTINHEPLEKQKQKRAAPIALPSTIPADAWEMWDRYRNSKKGWTADAKALSLRTLSDLVAKGQNPRKVVEQSVERGWTGLFPLKADVSTGSTVDSWAGRDI